MAMKEIRIEYNEHRLKALKTALENNGDGFTESIMMAIDNLYEKVVPESVKREVMDQVIADSQNDWRDKNTFSIIHLHSEDDDLFFTTRITKSPYELAKLLYYGYESFASKYTLDSMVPLFGETEIIDELMFNVLSDTATKDDRIETECHFNFDVRTMEIRSSNGEDMYGFDFDYISRVFDALDVSDFNEAEKERAFNASAVKYINECSGENPTEDAVLDL